MVEIGARARIHRVLRVLVDAFGEPRRALRQIVVELRAQWAPLRMECAGRRIGARLRIRVRGAGVERGRHAIAAVDLEVVELPRLPVLARGPRRAGEVCVRGGIVDVDVRIREADQRLRECVGRADADVPLRRCVERVVARDGARGIRAARAVHLRVRRADRQAAALVLERRAVEAIVREAARHADARPRAAARGVSRAACPPCRPSSRARRASARRSRSRTTRARSHCPSRRSAT